ncbi:helix-turn-helix domain-containing protein [Parafrankia sp. BMG5.11]|uniref:helix-turn-helix domain-containing protein n=1 Tax=Parafrankia sp. BMG5.11 TaxID=222540 RepID=UPI001A9FCC33|nr:XRE family transcriptional regulator [Parafrankia sp. BMG5.11]
MATADPAAMGRRIAEARERAGLTQAALASTISLDRSALTKVENGTRRVSALELARIAEALDERIEWFVLDPPPALVSHRNLQEPGAASPSIDRAVERVVRNVEFVQREDVRWSLGALPEMNRPGSVGDAEACAVKARTLLGLDGEEPFLDMSERLSRFGLLPFSLDLGSETADAASILLARGGVAVVNGHLHVGRRRLALAHELGHYLFADPYSVDWRIGEQSDEAAWETRVDRFARAILLPAQGLKRRWADLRRQGDDLRTAAVKVGSVFRVDMSTLARRLSELRQVDQSEVGRIRSVRTTRADIVELNLVPRDELAAPSLPRGYQEAVLRLYRGEIVTSHRALDLLFDTFEESDLPVLETLPESAIWKFVS